MGKRPQGQGGKQNHLTPTIDMGEEECFHSTFVCTTSPDPRLNGKPSISRTTAHAQEDKTLDFTSCNSTALTPKNVLSDLEYHTREEGISAATSNSGQKAQQSTLELRTQVWMEKKHCGPNGTPDPSTKAYASNPNFAKVSKSRPSYIRPSYAVGNFLAIYLRVSSVAGIAIHPAHFWGINRQTLRT